MTSTSTPPETPGYGWWQREKQRRQIRLLIVLLLALILIGYFYFISRAGRTGLVDGVTFDTANRVAFIQQDKSGNTNLCSVKADGTDLRMLTQGSDKSQKDSPTWTMGGHHVIYASNLHDANRTQLYILGAGQPVQLTYGMFRKDDPVCSPDGRHVAFITQGFIKTVLTNGNNVVQLLPAPIASNQPDSNGMQSLNPVGPYIKAEWAADGTGIAGVQQLSTQGNTDIPGLTGDTEMARALPASADHGYVLDFGRFADISWQPHGTELMVSFAERMVKNPVTGKEVYTGGISLWDFSHKGRPKETPLYISVGDTLMPRRIAWSPDGKQIAMEGYILEKNGDRKPMGIYLLPIPTHPLGFNGQQVPPGSIPVSQQGAPTHPVWSPNGDRILFEVRRADDKHDLWVVNSDLTNPINLTHGAAGGTDNTQGVWSPATK